MSLDTILRLLSPTPEKYFRKLSLAKAREIRAQYPDRTLADLGREFDVSKEAIRQVVLGVTWKERQ
jgi:hypothetical protein